MGHPGKRSKSYAESEIIKLIFEFNQWHSVSGDSNAAFSILRERVWNRGKWSFQRQGITTLRVSVNMVRLWTVSLWEKVKVLIHTTPKIKCKNYRSKCLEKPQRGSVLSIFLCECFLKLDSKPGNRAREMALLANCLLYKHEDLSSDSQNPNKKPRTEGTCL